MKILVCISKVPDTTAKISFTADGTSLDESGIQFIMNPYDEWYALVRALELKEAQGGTVTVINVGDNSNDTIIRKALAIGADDAIRVDAEASSSMFVAKQIAEVAKEYDIIFTGKETINYNSSEIGAMIAGFLDLPFVSYASHLEMSSTTATITRDIEGGSETVEVATPFVLSAAKGLAEQRIPNMRGIMMAKRKPLKVVEAVDYQDMAKPVEYRLPEDKGGVQYIEADNMKELVRLLHEEAKVI